MTRDQAMREARKRWGKNAIIEMRNQGVSSPEAREEATAKRDAHQAVYEALVKEKNDRLAQLDWLQELNAQIKAVGKLKSDESWRTHYYRFSVGNSMLGLAFMVQGQGDTWEEAFAKVKK